MTAKNLIVGAVVVVLLAIAINTYFVIQVSSSITQRHNETSTKIANLEHELMETTGGTVK